MAKKKSSAENVDLDDVFNDLASETGGDVLSELESVKYRIDTGNLAINYSCSGKCIGGGIPGGRITEAFGGEASGKSLIGANVLGSIQKLGGWAVILDCENATNGDFMEKISHLNLKRVLRYSPPTLERSFRQIHVTTKKIREREQELKLERKPILFVFDSLTVPPCERELKENNLPLDYSVADWKRIVGRLEQPGERARVISSEMRKLQSMVVDEDVTVYLINQTRDMIGVMYGNPETTPGGKAVKFYSSLRIRTAAKKKIEHKTLEKFSGINMQVKNVKNRGFRPFVVADDVKLYFENGIDPISGLLNCLIEGERIEMKSGGNYLVKPDYLPEGQTEYKFKASKAENRLPVQVILDCPKLVNATTTEEVQEYLNCWDLGLSASESGEYGEKSVDFDADGNPFETGGFDDDADTDE
jgi:recombination protein RecA